MALAQAEQAAAGRFRIGTVVCRAQGCPGKPPCQVGGATPHSPQRCRLEPSAWARRAQLISVCRGAPDPPGPPCAHQASDRPVEAASWLHHKPMQRLQSKPPLVGTAHPLKASSHTGRSGLVQHCSRLPTTTTHDTASPFLGAHLPLQKGPRHRPHRRERPRGEPFASNLPSLVFFIPEAKVASCEINRLRENGPAGHFVR